MRVRTTRLSPAYLARMTRNLLTGWSVAVCGLAASLAIPHASIALGQVQPDEAARMGLENAWQAQMQLPKAGRGVVSSHLWVDPKISKQYAVVELADRTIRVSADQLDRKGNPIGLEEAKKQAQEQATRLMFGKSDGFQVVEVTVPHVSLVVVSGDGMVHNLDAETGNLIWATSCGRTGAPAHPAAVSPAGVTVIHGTELYLIDWATGNQLMRRKLRSGSSNAVAVCDDIAFVSDFQGQVEAYGLGRTFTPWAYVLNGRAVGQPVTTADHAFAAIATTKGYAYIFHGGEKPSVWIRYETKPAISGSISVGNGAFYVASTLGVLGKITADDRLGTVRWEFRAGKSVARPALVVNDQVFLATEAGDFIAIDDSDGTAQWSLPLARVSTPIAVANKNVYCITSSNQLLAINSETGRLGSQSGVINLNDPVANSITDRVYLITKFGQVQCLRPIGGILPNLVTPVVVEEKPEETATESTAPTTSPSGDSNPFDFGGDADSSESPFGGGDPFGGGTDPFGGSTTADDADPFGSD